MCVCVYGGRRVGGIAAGGPCITHRSLLHSVISPGKKNTHTKQGNQFLCKMSELAVIFANLNPRMSTFIFVTYISRNWKASFKRCYRRRL